MSAEYDCRNLVNERDIIEKNFRKLYLNPENIKGTWLKKADADSSDLIEILVTTTREQKKAMGLGRNFCEKMIKHFELIKSPRYLRLMWSLCMERRDQSLKIDQGTAQEVRFL